MKDFDAVGIAEGWIECDSKETYLAAWQYLHDTGLAYRLQGWFGRTARALLDAGHIQHNTDKAKGEPCETLT